MSRRIWPLFILLTCLGCQRAPMATPPKTGLPGEVAADRTIAASEKAALEKQPVPADRAISDEKIFDTLTANSWKTLPLSKWHPDHSVSTFRADGTYSFDFHTDYHVPTKTGKWNLQFLQGQWYLCQDDGGRAAITLNDDGTITLRFGKLHPHEPLPREPGQTAKTLPPLKLLPEVQEIVRRLTGHTWKRTNDLDLRMEPTLVRFRPDWTYTAAYRGGECKSEGTWNAKTDEISAMSPKGRCDDRPGTGGDSLTAKIIDDRKILVNWDLYVPENEPVPRGIIWGLSGFEPVVNIRVEYDMPIRRGVPVRFDVTITNGGHEPLKLERFSLSGGYGDYGRNVGDPGKQLVPPEDEIAGHDLAGKMLDPSKSHSFSLTAELPKAGQHWVYFNGLVSGTTQNWDIHQAHEVTAKE